MAAFATSYIPTVAATVTRNADAASMTGTNFSSWFNNAEGTLYSEGNSFYNQDATNGGILSIDDNSSANRIQIRRLNNVSSPSAAYIVTDSTVTQASANFATWALNTNGKIILAYKVNDFAASFNGSSVSTDTAGTVPTSVNRAQIGVGGGIQYFNGTIRRIAYYPTRLSNAQLQALTTV